MSTKSSTKEPSKEKAKTTKKTGTKATKTVVKTAKKEAGAETNAKMLEKQAKEILAIAEQYGVEQNFLFLTTFKRYQVQLSILNELEKKIDESGALVTKEYVKGRENLYTNPAIREYNNTCTSANATVSILIKIIKSLRNGDDDEQEDELLNALGVK